MESLNSGPASIARALSRLEVRRTGAEGEGVVVVVSLVRGEVALLERIKLTLPGRGRNLSGMDSHVLRPMMTAFFLDGSVVLEVSSLKYFMSPGRFHGSFPSGKWGRKKKEKGGGG